MFHYETKTEDWYTETITGREGFGQVAGYEITIEYSNEEEDFYGRMDMFLPVDRALELSSDIENYVQQFNKRNEA